MAANCNNTHTFWRKSETVFKCDRCIEAWEVITKRTKTSLSIDFIVYWWSWIYLHIILSMKIMFQRFTDWLVVKMFHSTNDFKTIEPKHEKKLLKMLSWKLNVSIVHIFDSFECFESVLFVLRPVSCASGVCML